MVPPGFSHTLSKTSQISKIISFLVVNTTGSIRFAPSPPLKNFLPTFLRVTVKIELLSSSTKRSVKIEDELDLASTTSSLLGDLKKKGVILPEIFIYFFINSDTNLTQT